MKIQDLKQEFVAQISHHRRDHFSFNASKWLLQYEQDKKRGRS